MKGGLLLVGLEFLMRLPLRLPHVVFLTYKRKSNDNLFSQTKSNRDIIIKC